MKNVKEMKRELRKREETKTGDGNQSKHVTVLWFLGLICNDLHFFLIFLPETRLSKVKFRLLNHLNRISIKIDMIFGSWLLCKHPCFDIGSEITSNHQDFD